MGACSSRPKTAELEVVAAVDIQAEKPHDQFTENYMGEGHKTAVESICRNVPSMCCKQVLLIENKTRSLHGMLVGIKEAGSSCISETNGKKTRDQIDQPCSDRKNSLAATACQTEMTMKLKNDTQTSRSQAEPRELCKEPGFVDPKTYEESNQRDGQTVGPGNEVLQIKVLLEQCQGTEHNELPQKDAGAGCNGGFITTNEEGDKLTSETKEVIYLANNTAYVDKPVMHDGAEGDEVLDKLIFSHQSSERGTFSVTKMDPNFSATLSRSVAEVHLVMGACKETTQSANPTPAELAHNSSTKPALRSDVMWRLSKASSCQGRSLSNADEKERMDPALRDPNMNFASTGDKSKTDVLWAYQVDADCSLIKRPSADAAEADNLSKRSSHKGTASDVDEVLDKLASEFERQESLSSSSRVLA